MRAGAHTLASCTRAQGRAQGLRVAGGSIERERTHKLGTHTHKLGTHTHKLGTHTHKLAKKRHQITGITRAEELIVDQFDPLCERIDASHTHAAHELCKLIPSPLQPTSCASLEN